MQSEMSFPPELGGRKRQPSPLRQRCYSRASCPAAELLDIAHIYPWAVEAGIKGQAIDLHLQERRTVAGCGHNA